jgi:hypothetical protein
MTHAHSHLASNANTFGGASCTTGNTAPATQSLWVPKRAIGATWEEIERKLDIVRTGVLGGEMQSVCELIVPADWSIIPSDVSPFHQRWLVDGSGNRLAKLYWKNYRGDCFYLEAAV